VDISNNLIESRSKTAWFGILNICSSQRADATTRIANNQILGASIGYVGYLGGGITRISDNYHESEYLGPFTFGPWENITSQAGIAVIGYPGHMLEGCAIENNEIAFRANPQVYEPGDPNQPPPTDTLTKGMFLGAALQYLGDTPFELPSVVENMSIKGNTIRSEVPLDFGITLRNKSNNNAIAGNTVVGDLKPAAIGGLEPAFFDLREAVAAQSPDPEFEGAPYENVFTANTAIGSGRYGFRCDGCRNEFRGNNLTGIDPLPTRPTGALFKFTPVACGNLVRGYTGGKNTSVIDECEDPANPNDISGVK
jgi:hypothetical protein